MQTTPTTRHTQARKHLRIGCNSSRVLEAHTDCNVPSAKSNSVLWAVKQERALLQSAASIIQAELASVELRYARTYNALQPCHRLPNEVLSMIFEVGLPSQEDAWPASDDQKILLWTCTQYLRHIKSLSVTCSHFRAVVINTPKCWTIVSIEVMNLQRTTLDQVAACLARSETLPFDLFVNMEHDFQAGELMIRAFGILLAPHAHRCRSISSSQLDGHYAELLFPQETEFPALRHVDIECHHDNWVRRPQIWKSFLFGSCHRRLRSLRILDMDYHHHGVFQRPFETNNITRLWLELSDGVTCPNNILENFKALQHLSYSRTADIAHDVPLAGRAPTILPNLISFQLSQGLALRCEMPLIIAPELVQIRMHYACYPQRGETMFDPRFPRFGNLKRLEVPPFNFTPEVLLEYFQEPHNLEELALILSDTDDVVETKDQHRVISDIIGTLCMPSGATGELAGRLMRRVYFDIQIDDDAELQDSPIFASTQNLLFILPKVSVEVYVNYVSQTSVPFEKSLGGAWVRKLSSSCNNRVKIFLRESLSEELDWPNAWPNGWSGY